MNCDRGFDAQAMAALQCGGQTHESSAALRLYTGRGTVAAEKLAFIETVSRQPACQTLGHARVTCQRAVLGAGKLKTLMQGGGQCSQYTQTDPSEVHGRFPCVNGISFYST